MPLRKSLFIKVMTLIFTTILFAGSVFLISQETFNTILNHKQHLSVRPDAGVIQLNLTHTSFIGFMITNAQIFTTQIITVSQYKILFFSYFSTHCYTKHTYQMASRKWCIPFGKHCDFLEGIACLRTGTSFLVLPSFL